MKLPSPLLIGVNSRNLSTLKIDLHGAAELVRSIPPERFAVSESGIHTRVDVERLKKCGARAILVGESLLRGGDIRAKIRELIG